MALAGLAATLAAPATAKRRIYVLDWSGRAHLEVDGRSLELVSRTRLEVPLLRVRSTSWIVAQGPATARTMILEPDGQWVERGGTRAPLPVQLGVHERQQYAIYAWLLLVQQRKRPRPGPLPLSAPPYPDIVFQIGSDGFPVAADLTVDADEPGKPRIVEHVAFEGRIDNGRIRWPRRFVLAQDGRPYFTLDIERFTAT